MEETTLLMNIMWTMLGAFLVYFMQAGFAMVETGFTRAKNAGNICMKNMMDFVLGSLFFFILGFPHVRKEYRRHHRRIRFSKSLFPGGCKRDDQRTPHRRIHDFPYGVLCHCRDHRLRRHGGTDEILFLPRLFGSDQYLHLSGDRPLDLGRRMAGRDRLSRFCRFHGRSHGWRRMCICRSKNRRSPAWEIQQRRDTERNSRP